MKKSLNVAGLLILAGLLMAFQAEARFGSQEPSDETFRRGGEVHNGPKDCAVLLSAEEKRQIQPGSDAYNELEACSQQGRNTEPPGDEQE